MSFMIPDSIAQFKLPDGSVVRLEDWVDKPVFSTVELLSGFTDQTIGAFTYIAGEEVPASGNVTVRRTSTERDTNMASAGGAASTEEILVFAVRAEVYEFSVTGTDATTAVVTGRTGQPMPSANNLAVLNAALTLRLMVSQKAYVEEGFGYFNQGFGPFASNAALSQSPGATGRTLATPGLPSDEAIRYYRMPHHIGGTEKFRVELKNYPGATIQFLTEAATPANVATLLHRVIIHLEGARKRPTA